MQISIHDHTLIVIHALLGIASLTHAAPQENQHVDVDPQYNTFLTLTDFETANELKPEYGNGDVKRKNSNSLVSRKRLHLFYLDVYLYKGIGGNENASRERAILARAVQTYHEKTCIRFVPRNARKHTDYLVIGKIDGCFSDVGRAGGRQELSLDIGCIEYDTAIHELMHAVGFWHEHERWDRDRFIYINWPNIETDAYDQFGKVNLYESDYYSENYDYLSIMHYDSKSFTRNGRNTMEARKQEYTYLIGRVKDFSSVDLRKIRKMYNCDEKQYSALKATKPKIERRKIPNPVKSTVAHPPPKLEAFRIHSTRKCKDKATLCWKWVNRCRTVQFKDIMQEFCANSCGFCT